jgi:hypothetical protein
MIETKLDLFERALIFTRFGEMSAILHRRLEERHGIEVSSVVVECQELSATAWSIALSRATVKDRVSSYFRFKQAVQVRT